MTSRERVKKTLNHEQPDRVPLDLGSTSVTGIAAGALHRLREGLGLERKTIKVHEPFQILGQVEEDVIERLGVDVVGLWSMYSFFGYRNTGWKKWNIPGGMEVLVGEGFMTKVDEKGDTYIFPQGDMTVPPCAKLPKGGFYFDNIVRQEPYDEDMLNGREDFEGQFTLYSDEELKYFEEESGRIYKDTQYAIIGNFSGAGLGDVALLPAANMKKTPGIRSAEEWYMAHLLFPEYIKEIFDFQTEIAIKNLELYRQAVGDRIEAIFISGTDFGTQRSEFISPDLFREIYKPYYKKINDWVHKNTPWKTFFHSCGSIPRLLDDFIDMGVDILNPVQCSAYGMEAEFLKEKYGDRLVFWGGGIDTQQVLPFGTPQEVRGQVKERLAIFSKGGGYVFNPIHNIQAPTPVENMLALYGALKEFNGR